MLVLAATADPEGGHAQYVTTAIHTTAQSAGGIHMTHQYICWQALLTK